MWVRDEADKMMAEFPVVQHINASINNGFNNNNTTRNMAPKVTLFAHGVAPNPPKVAILLEELGVEYKIVNKVSSTGLIRSHTYYWCYKRSLEMVLVASKLKTS